MRYVVIIGCSRTARELAISLSENNNVVVVDKDLKALDALGDDFNGKKIWADALDINILEKAGIKDAQALIILTDNDNLNLVLGKVARRKYSLSKVIVQVNDAVKKRLFQEEGLTILNRTYLMAEIIKKRMG